MIIKIVEVREGFLVIKEEFRTLYANSVLPFRVVSRIEEVIEGDATHVIVIETDRYEQKARELRKEIDCIINKDLYVGVVKIEENTLWIGADEGIVKVVTDVLYADKKETHAFFYTMVESVEERYGRELYV